MTRIRTYIHIRTIYENRHYRISSNKLRFSDLGEGRKKFGKFQYWKAIEMHNIHSKIKL